MIQITAADLKIQLGKYLDLAEHEDIHITKNGTDIAVLTAPKAKKSWIAKYVGIIPDTADINIKQFRAERAAKK